MSVRRGIRVTMWRPGRQQGEQGEDGGDPFHVSLLALSTPLCQVSLPRSHSVAGSSDTRHAR
jgi:hypothetical protein